MALDAPVTLQTQETEIAEIQIPSSCPLCQRSLAQNDSSALIVRFCRFGCGFNWQAFADWDAAYDPARELFEAASYDECCAMSDALNERTAILMTENGFDYEDAVRAAEADLIPKSLDEFRLKINTRKGN